MLFHQFGYVNVALVDYNAFRIVVELCFNSFDVVFNVLEHKRIDVKLLQNPAVALEDLYRIPSLLLLGKMVDGSLLYVCQGVLDNSREDVHWGCNSFSACLDRGFCRLNNTVAFQSGDLDDLASKLAAQGVEIYPVASFSDDVHHIYGNNNGNAKLG